jgi:hypothetical protein
MIIYDIPYSPIPAGAFVVNSSHDGAQKFPSRTDALRFAIEAALRAGDRGEVATINIEGADGRWRLFDRTAKGLS